MTEERRVWIAQCLCPKRHAIVAAVCEADDVDDAEVAALRPLHLSVAATIAEGVLNPWCGICGAKQDTWRYELGRTRFRTLEEARPHLEANEAEQAVARVVLGGRPAGDRLH